MRLVTTLLTAMAVCTVLLVGVAFYLDAPIPAAPSTGLRASTILGTDETALGSGALDPAPNAVATDGIVRGARTGDQG
jgi:hypothetical protein